MLILDITLLDYLHMKSPKLTAFLFPRYERKTISCLSISDRNTAVRFSNAGIPHVVRYVLKIISCLALLPELLRDQNVRIYQLEHCKHKCDENLQVLQDV